MFNNCWESEGKDSWPWPNQQKKLNQNPTLKIDSANESTSIMMPWAAGSSKTSERDDTVESKLNIDFETKIHDAKNVFWNSFSNAHSSYLSTVICSKMKNIPHRQLSAQNFPLRWNWSTCSSRTHFTGDFIYLFFCFCFKNALSWSWWLADLIWELLIPGNIQQQLHP